MIALMVLTGIPQVPHRIRSTCFVFILRKKQQNEQIFSFIYIDNTRNAPPAPVADCVKDWGPCYGSGANSSKTEYLIKGVIGDKCKLKTEYGKLIILFFSFTAYLMENNFFHLNAEL